jgi:hypothetical protein
LGAHIICLFGNLFPFICVVNKIYVVLSKYLSPGLDKEYRWSRSESPGLAVLPVGACEARDNLTRAAVDGVFASPYRQDSKAANRPDKARTGINPLLYRHKKAGTQPGFKGISKTTRN